jgi:hypothetical protein
MQTGTAVVLVDHRVRQSHARHHDERARSQHRRGESAVLGQLAEVSRRLDSCPAPFYLAAHVFVASACPTGGIYRAVPSH